MAMMNLNGNILVAIDTETTGLTAGYHEVYQIGAVALDANMEIDKSIQPLDLWIRPQYLQRADYKAIKMRQDEFLNKISIGLLEETAIECFENWFNNHLKPPPGKKILPIGHNYAAHDCVFLKHLLGNHAYHSMFHHHVRDTMLTAIHLNDVAGYLREPFPFPRVDLRNVCSYLGIDLVERHQHDALYDATLCAQVYYKQVHSYLNDLRKGYNDSVGQ